MKTFITLFFLLMSVFSFADTTKTIDNGLYFRFLILEHSDARGDTNRFSINKEELNPDSKFQGFSISLPAITNASDLASIKGSLKIGTEVWTFINESIVNIGDGKLIVDAALNVNNKGEGTAKFISKEPYPTIKVAGNQLQRIIEFIEVGISIKVKPEIKGDKVESYVSVSVSEVMRQSEENNEFQVPIVASRDLETFIDFNFGEMEILSELTVDKKITLSKGIPFLRNIPWIGKILFTSSQKSITKTKLYIVGGVDMANKNNLKSFKKKMNESREDIEKTFPFK